MPHPQNGGSAVRLPSGLSFKLNGSMSVDVIESLIIGGYVFEFAKVFSGFTTAVPFYSRFENPSDSDVAVLLIKRTLKSYSGGITDFNILWDYNVDNLTPTSIEPFNKSNRYRSSKLAKAEISALNLFEDETPPDYGDWTITATAVTPTSIGIEREPDFIPTTGVGVNTAGGVSPDSGVRIYWPGTGFLTRSISSSTGNRLLWGYEWAEIPLEFFSEE